MIEHILQIDTDILNFIYNSMHSTLLDTLMPIFSLIDDSGLIWIIISAILIIFPKYRKCGIAILLGLTLGLLVCNLTLKPLVARIRPYELNSAIELLIQAPSDYSFPSGHTVSSFSAATVLMLRNKKLGVPALGLASLIAFSRLYLYVHYPTDILGGIVLGILLGYISFRLIHHFSIKKELE